VPTFSVKASPDALQVQLIKQDKATAEVSSDWLSTCRGCWGLQSKQTQLTIFRISLCLSILYILELTLVLWRIPND
jgi:hypothetical protein